jgi:hypothetical protein
MASKSAAAVGGSATTARVSPPPAKRAVEPLAALRRAADDDLAAVGTFLSRHWNVRLTGTAVKSARSAIATLAKQHGVDPARLRTLSAPTPGAKEQPQAQLARAVYAFGMLAGESYAAVGARPYLRDVNRDREGRGLPPLTVATPASQIDSVAVMSSLARSLAREVKAEPKGYATYRRTAGEFDPPGPEAEDFEGRPPYGNAAAAGSGGFGAAASRARVFYNEARQRPPLDSLLLAVFAQGANLSVESIQAPIIAESERLDARPTGRDAFG